MGITNSCELMFLMDGESEPSYTCKHCGKKVWFLMHDGRWWKCKACFDKVYHNEI